MSEYIKRTDSLVLRLTIILVSVLMPLMVSAQKHFRSFSKMQGLSDNSVCCVQQDSHGFLWLGTFDGLCRFDGTTFETFKNSASDKYSLADDVVRDILPVDSGLWVATDMGIDFYSFNDGRFHHSKGSEKGKATGLSVRFNKFVKTPERLFAVDIRGQIWEHQQNYLYTKVNQHNERFDALTTYNDNMLIAVGPKGIYLLDGMAETVIDHYKFNADVSTLTNIYYSKNKSTVFVGYGIGFQSRAFKIENNHIKELDTYVPSGLMCTLDYGEYTVFGVDGGGLIFDNSITRTTYTTNNSNISGDAVYSLFADNQDNLWIGTYRTGLGQYSERFRWFSILNKENRQLSYNIVTSIVADGDLLYIGLDGGGLEIHNMLTHSCETFNTDNSMMPGDNVVSMVKDDKYLWMAVYSKGLVRFSLTDHSIKTYRMPLTEHDANNVWIIKDDGVGNIWIGGPVVFVFNKNSETPMLLDGINRADCSDICMVGNDVWLSCRYKGIYKYNRLSRKFQKHYSKDNVLPSNNIPFIHADKTGNIWFGVEHAGFYCFDPQKGVTACYNEVNGLTDQNVTTMQPDGQGNYIVGTYNGLFLFTPSTGRFVRLIVDEAISEYTYNSSILYHDVMYFGSTRGLVYFQPSKIRLPKLVNTVRFTSIELNNADRRKINLYIDHPEGIKLKHDENFFTVHYAVPELVSPGRVLFSCRLEGLESEWREMGSDRDVAYTNVPPGKYLLLVRSIASDGQWAEPSVLEIIISPPWYLTWWADIIWGGLLLLLAYIGVRFYLHELDLKHKMELAGIEKESERKLNDAKMNFYTSITHELRTPVFLIMAQLEEILDEAKESVKVPSAYLFAIHRNAQRLNKLISRVIDFRKVGAENLQISLKRDDVVGFCKSFTEEYTEMFRQKKIDYRFESSSSEIMLDFDSLKLELIISNLISNAFKYTKENGRVVLSVKEAADSVEFVVKDNGIGIDERVRDTIFESFFRSERGKKQGEGDGLGLSYVKSLVELHGGKINVESEMGIGSEFKFFIPKQKSTPSTTVSALATHELNYTANPTALQTILIIDDEPETADLLERSLEKSYRVVKAYNGEEGLQKVIETLPDLILCDVMMPKMDGLTFLKELKADKKLQHIKIIIFTADTSEKDMMTAFDNDVDAYITKPISLSLLRKRIDKLLGTTEEKVYSKEDQLFLLKCREIIDNNLNNPDLNIETLIDALAMSHSSIYKKIKAITGMSVIEFINDYKIYKAVHMFRHGETNVESVAEACGFKEARTFRTLFKRKTNMTPKQFVQSL